MKPLFTLIFLTFTLCPLIAQVVEAKNDPKKHPYLTNKKSAKQIAGRPIEFYLNHKDIGTPAKLFYKGEYALYDDEETFAILDGILTKNNNTRPFYFFIYNEAMKVTDGALAEYMATSCRRYLEMYPCEFLTSIENHSSQLDLEKWTDFIAFDIYDTETFDKLSVDIDKKVRTNCSEQNLTWGKVKLKVKKYLELNRR